MGETLQNMELERTVGLRADGAVWLPERRAAVSSILLKLAAMGVRIPAGAGDEDVLHLAGDLFARYREQTRLLSEHLCPADQRIQRYIDGLLAVGGRRRPRRACRRRRSSSTATAWRASCRCRSTRTPGTTSWSRATGSTTACCTTPSTTAARPRASSTSPRAGSRSPRTRLRVPLVAYLRLLRGGAAPAGGAAAPAVHGQLAGAGRDDGLAAAAAARLPRGAQSSPEKRMEVRFFAPGGLVSNLDFVESIFGNAGDPYLPENDAALDVDHWTGHSGCVILAPHLTRLRKKDLGLPHVSRATDAERAAGMCWADEGELYNDGRPFKITSREHRRRDGHDPGRQLLRLLQEGGEDPDRLQRQPVRPGRGGARRRRAGVRHLQPGRPLRAGAGADREREPPVRGGAGAGRPAGDVPRPRATPPTAIYPEIHYMPEDMEIDVHPPGHQVDQQGPGAAPQAPARPHLHPPERLQGAPGEAPRGAELAADRHGARGRLLPQAVHRLGRRQVGDQQEPGRRGAARVDLRPELRGGHGAGPGDLRPDYDDARLPSPRADARPRGRSCRPSARSAR